MTVGRKVTILDSSLRDGAQGIGIAFSVEDKLNVVKQLDKLGICYVEAGNPAANPKELEFFKRAKKLHLKDSKITAFGSTRRKNSKAELDTNLKALLQAETDVYTIFGKSAIYHVQKVLETTERENLCMIEETCAYLKSFGKEVLYDAEHFFDGYKENKAYALDTLKAAIKGGADLICLCDTNGGIFPHEAQAVLKEVLAAFAVPVGVHFHDDCGVAVANSIACVLAGASQVQGTFLGFGERCGNANLSAVIPSLQLKFDVNCMPADRLGKITETAREIAAAANIDISENMPYIGKNAFAHKAGMHADGVLKARASFEHINPETVGNTRMFPASEISGKSVILEKIRTVMPGTHVNEETAKQVLKKIKTLEMRGYQFEAADASFALLVRKLLQPFPPFFELLYYNINTSFGNDIPNGASAIVKVKVGEKVQLMAAEGNGPVNALDQALRKALELFYPQLKGIKLTDYKVRVLEGKNATASGVRVFITSSDGINTYTTVGVSEDVVAASWKALEDSMEYLLLRPVDND